MNLLIKQGTSYFVKIPIAVGLLLIDVIVVPIGHLVAFGHFSKTDWIKTFSNGWLHFISLCIYFIVHYIHQQQEKKEIQENKLAIEALKDMQNELLGPIKEYSKYLLREALRQINTSINTLLNSGARNQTLIKKIEIITSLIKDVSDKNIKRFWATCYDLPSELIEDFEDYFKAQAEYLPKSTYHTGLIPSKIIDKSRVVILTRNNLVNEITKKGELLRKFIDWHSDNNFQLRFLLNYNYSFEKKTNSIVTTGINNSDYLTDFSVIGNDWIYGESTQLRGSTHDAINKINSLDIGEDKKKEVIDAIELSATEADDIYTLRLHSNSTINKEVWVEYENLYHELWYQWHHNEWPMMCSEQVIAEIDRNENLERNKEKRLKHYNTKFPSLKDLSGENFCKALFAIFKKFRKKRIFATDLLSLKVDKEFEKWSSPIYQEWLAINNNLAKNCSCEIQRIYILNKKISNRSQAIEKFNLILKPQITAGIKIFVVDYKQLVDDKIKFHDFVLVEKELCSSTQWYEYFETESYSIENNFDDLIYSDNYQDVFLNLRSKAKEINEWPDDKIITFLTNLTFTD